MTPIYKAFRTPEHRQSLGVYYDGQRFFAVKNVEKLYSVNQCSTYCPECCIVFRESYKHREYCPLRCPDCTRYGYNFPCEPSEKVYCQKCNRNFRNTDCFAAHLTPNGQKSWTVCDMIKNCPKCSQTFKTDNEKNVHVCGQDLCFLCLKVHDLQKGCSNVEFTFGLFIVSRKLKEPFFRRLIDQTAIGWIHLQTTNHILILL